MSVNLSDSKSQFNDQGDEEEEFFRIYGMYFCGACKNIMTPLKQNEEKLQFKCKQCQKKEIDFKLTEGEDCIIYNKELKPGSKSAKPDKQFIHDRALPKVEAKCPQCNCQIAYYIINPDPFESAIQIKMICANPKQGRCYNTWTLPLDEKIEGNKVVVNNRRH